MADGRGYTIQNSSKLVDSFVMAQNAIEPEDNYGCANTSTNRTRGAQ